MSYSLSSLLHEAINAGFALLLAFAFAGSIVKLARRYVRWATWICQSATILTCATPILWSWGAEYPTSTILLALAGWGATAGAVHYIIGFFYRYEAAQLKSKHKLS